MRCQLRYSLRRAECSRCGVKVEKVPWAEPDSGFTRPFEEFVALMAQRTDKTFVTGLLRIAWYTVGRIVERVTRRLGGDPLARLHGVRHIGIDELGLNRKIRVVTSRAYGFKNVDNLMAMITLCCGGLAVPWPHVLPC